MDKIWGHHNKIKEVIYTKNLESFIILIFYYKLTGTCKNPKSSPGSAMIRGNNLIRIHRCMTCRYFLSGTWGLPADEPHLWRALLSITTCYPHKDFLSLSSLFPYYYPCISLTLQGLHLTAHLFFIITRTIVWTYFLSLSLSEFIWVSSFMSATMWFFILFCLLFASMATSILNNTRSIWLFSSSFLTYASTFLFLSTISSLFSSRSLHYINRDWIRSWIYVLLNDKALAKNWTAFI